MRQGLIEAPDLFKISIPEHMEGNMRQLELVIGDKNVSSWSLRSWLLLKQAGIPFSETLITLRQPDTAAQVLRHSASGKIPVLKDGPLRVWDSLAIAEYVAETFPEKALWPKDRARRAVARSVSAEMHAGFPDLRSELSMNILAHFPRPALSSGAERDVARIQAIWRECRDATPADAGPFLFGAFSIADAFYAPVVTRFLTYSIAMEGAVAAYAEAIMALPAMSEWRAGAEAEAKVVYG